MKKLKNRFRTEKYSTKVELFYNKSDINLLVEFNIHYFPLMNFNSNNDFNFIC
jgi:hypothetical protein